MSVTLPIELLSQTPAKDRSFFQSLAQKMEADPSIMDKVCHVLSKKISDQQLADHFSELSVESKMQACIEHLIIGVVSGDITKQEIADLIETV